MQQHFSRTFDQLLFFLVATSSSCSSPIFVYEEGYRWVAVAWDRSDMSNCPLEVNQQTFGIVINPQPLVAYHVCLIYFSWLHLWISLRGHCQQTAVDSGFFLFTPFKF